MVKCKVKISDVVICTISLQSCTLKCHVKVLVGGSSKYGVQSWLSWSFENRVKNYVISYDVEN